MRKLLIMLGMLGLLLGPAIGTAGATGFTLPDSWEFGNFQSRDGFPPFDPSFDLSELLHHGNGDGLPDFPFDIAPRFFILPHRGELNPPWIHLHHLKKHGRFHHHHTVVPEPSTAILLALGLVGLARVGRRAR